MMGERGGGQVSHLLVFVSMKERLENADSCRKNDHTASLKLFTSILAIFNSVFFMLKVLFLITQEIAKNLPCSACLASL